MRAAGFTEWGGPDVVHLIELPRPEPGRGEVVVAVAAASVNPTDTLLRAGKQAKAMEGIDPPYVAGVEFAGHVHAMGEGVTGLQPGQPVLGLVESRRPGGGAHAEFVRVPAASLATLPPETDLVKAATVAMNGLTAKLAIEALDLAPGSSVLVTGGAGAVGGYAIQIAKLKGLVVAADAKESDVPLLRSFGADVVVPRGPAMGDALRAHFPDGLNGLVDAAMLRDVASALVRDGGAAVSLRSTAPIEDPRLRAHVVQVFSDAKDQPALAWLAERLLEGTLTPRVATQLPLDEGAQAHRLVEQGGLRGRVVLLPS